MKLKDILTLFTLSVIVKGAWWAAAVQPVVLSLGTMMAAVDLDVLDANVLHLFDWRKWIPGRKKEEKAPAPVIDVKQEQVEKIDTKSTVLKEEQQEKQVAEQNPEQKDNSKKDE